MAPAPEEKRKKKEEEKEKEKEKEKPCSRRDAKPEKQLLLLPSVSPPTSLFAMASSSQTLSSPPDSETLGTAISSQRRRLFRLSSLSSPSVVSKQTPSTET